MLEFKDFYRIAKYANDNWNYHGTDEEIAESAHLMLEDWENVVEKCEGGIQVSEDDCYNLVSMLVNLKEDVINGEHSEEVLNWISELEKYFEVEVG